MSTAIQNIERRKGAREERKWMIAEVRSCLKMYKNDLVLKLLLDILLERDRNIQ